MSRSDASVNAGGGAWVQLPLIPPEVVEIRLTIGVVQSDDHCQFQIEAWDASGNELIAMRSHPHVVHGHAHGVLDQYVHWARQMLHQAINPF